MSYWRGCNGDIECSYEFNVHFLKTKSSLTHVQRSSFFFLLLSFSFSPLGHFPPTLGPHAWFRQAHCYFCGNLTLWAQGSPLAPVGGELAESQAAFSQDELLLKQAGLRAVGRLQQGPGCHRPGGCRVTSEDLRLWGSAGGRPCLRLKQGGVGCWGYRPGSQGVWKPEEDFEASESLLSHSVVLV